MNRDTYCPLLSSGLRRFIASPAYPASFLALAILINSVGSFDLFPLSSWLLNDVESDCQLNVTLCYIAATELISAIFLVNEPPRGSVDGNTITSCKFIYFFIRDAIRLASDRCNWLSGALGLFIYGLQV